MKVGKFSSVVVVVVGAVGGIAVADVGQCDAVSLENPCLRSPTILVRQPEFSSWPSPEPTRRFEKKVDSINKTTAFQIMAYI